LTNIKNQKLSLYRNKEQKRLGKEETMAESENRVESGQDSSNTWNTSGILEYNPWFSRRLSPIEGEGDVSSSEQDVDAKYNVNEDFLDFFGFLA
jgi:hypothetical protein